MIDAQRAELKNRVWLKLPLLSVVTRSASDNIVDIVWQAALESIEPEFTAGLKCPVCGSESADHNMLSVNKQVQLQHNQIESLQAEIDQLNNPWISVDKLPDHSKDVRLWVDFRDYDSCEMIGFKQVVERAGRKPRETLIIPQCDTSKHVPSQNYKILFWAEQTKPPISEG